MTISVALTTYNGQRFLRQQLDSLARQTTLPDELVVVDDRSTDDTWAMLADFAKTSPFPVRRYQNDVRLGWRRNFMHALSLCNSDMIALCDQDDVWMPEKLAIAEKALSKPDAVLFCHDAYLIDKLGRRFGAANLFALPDINAPLSIIQPFSPYGFSIVFKRELLSLSDLWEVSVDSDRNEDVAPHDQWLFFLATVFGTIVYSSEQLVGYRQHGNNAVGLPVPRRLLARLWRFLLYWLTNPAHRFDRMESVARNRARILAASRDRLDGVWQERAIAGERAWSRFAESFGRRAELYGRPTLPDRLVCFLSLYKSGVYRFVNADGDLAALLRDAVAGVIFTGCLAKPSGTSPQTIKR